MAKPLVGSL